MFAVFVRYDKTPVGFIFAQYGKTLGFDFNIIGLNLRSCPILKSLLNILPYCAQKNSVSYNLYSCMCVLNTFLPCKQKLNYVNYNLKKPYMSIYVVLKLCHLVTK